MPSFTVWRTIKAHTAFLNFVTFSPSGELLATGDEGGNVFIWSLAGGKLFQALPPSPSPASSCCWRKDEELFIGYSNGTILFLELSVPAVRSI
ncbi:hypothetical protein AURDEDRAFT_172506 [Auricularia subglabra TFB-10046 SS5]|nr:hypothetical protein AURDEDRAFT_172506 [Auricularia subglabra TFB-10046 SS5]